ncbi:hypothetical protein ACH4PU_24365 [Streptomyces sp. NPDC021100]|uniref:hypothetical protein n=1 Tax=Streptomyces sp. NPDC021100 TaxID=3365114 RepID=UPI00379A1F2B
MRGHITKALGVLAAAGALCLALPGSSYAASGQLVLNGRIFDNPTGCFRNLNAPLSVQNKTTTAAHVFTTMDCTGPAQMVPPRQSTVVPRGRSVSI